LRKIGITGGIGAGKSTICSIIEHLGFPVYYADKEAKRLMIEDPEIIQGLVRLCGPEVFINGELNRFFLANLIFNNKTLLEQVNLLVHPKVKQDFTLWCEMQTHDILFYEAAVLFESGGASKMDKTIVVVADTEKRINRVMKRDQVSRDQVLERMDKQWSQEKKMELASFLIHNNEEPILIQVLEIIDKLG
jgi:dephospho-CoA kinase